VTDKKCRQHLQLDFDFIKEWAVIHGIDIGHSNEVIVKRKVSKNSEEIDH
jgi:long-chain acyl-CoA synthetase